MRKNKIKYFLAAMLLYKASVFAASGTTKQLIHKYLAKYGITSNKQDCNTDKEPKYDKLTGKVRCNEKFNNKNPNNYWSPKDRLCKECPVGTILNKITFQTCNQVNCPQGTVGIEVLGGNCPDGMELFAPSNGICPEGYELIKITNGKCPDGFELIDLRSNCPSGFEMFKQS